MKVKTICESITIPKRLMLKNEVFKGRQLTVGYFCPNCLRPVLIQDSYCYECGQALDWTST